MNATNEEDYNGRQYDGETNVSQAEEEERVTQTTEFEFHRTEAFAADDLVVTSAEDFLLSPNDESCGCNQYGSQYGTGTDGCEATCRLVNLFVDKSRDIVNTLFNTQNCYGTKVRHGVQHDEECTGHNGRQYQGNGNFAGDGQEASTGNACRFFQSGVHTFQRAAYLNEYEGEQVHNFNKCDAGIAVDVKQRLGSVEHFHPHFVDVTGVRRKEHFPSQCANEGRQHKGNKEQALHESFIR